MKFSKGGSSIKNMKCNNKEKKIKKMHFGKDVVPQFEVGAQQKKLVFLNQYYNDNHTKKVICYDTD